MVCRAVALVTLEQWVLLKFGFDELVQFLVGELQQLDGLLELGRDDQPLTLPNLKPLTDHYVPPLPPKAATARNLLSRMAGIR